MIRKAVILLPPRPKSMLHTDGIDPLVHLGGLTLIQRILYSLQWAGIEEGIILCYGDWQEVERHIREDPKNKAFSWLSLSSSQETDSPLEDVLGKILEGDFLLQLPGWIVDRKILRELISKEDPLTKPIVVIPADTQSSDEKAPVPLVVVPGKACPALVSTLKEKAPLETVKQRLAEIPDSEKRRLQEPALIRAEKKEDRLNAEHQLFQGLIKPTESLASRIFDRKISLAITRRLLNSRVTPNQISIVSILMGLVSALFFLPGHILFHIFGALLLVFSNIIDGCDGELARLRFQESRWGSWLDFLGDNLVHIAVFFCIGFGLYLRGEGIHYLILGSMGVIGTIGAAGSVFLRVFMTSGSSVVSFATPVRIEEMEHAEGRLRSQIDFAEKIGNRDFIYLILILSVTGQIWIWPWFNGPGTCFYFGYLLYLYKRMRAVGEQIDSISA